MSALIRWLPQLARASANDLARYGDEAARVRTLLDFLPTMSADARELARDAWNASTWDARSVAEDAARSAAYAADRLDARDYVFADVNKAAKEGSQFAALDAAAGEIVNDFITRSNYRILTNPLATGRAFDVLQPRSPENFLDVVHGLADRKLVRQPLDVLNARTLARAPKSEQQALMEVINAIVGNDGYDDTAYTSLADLIELARRLN